MTIFGPSEQFPEGKLNPDDQGELCLGVSTDMEKRVVVLRFGAEVTWMAMPPNDARTLGLMLLYCANIVEGVVN